jgi:assimilatory nitrate reductase catalytic subunit
VHGSNLVVSAPDATRVRERLAALDLLVVCDVVPSETARMADVVLPVTQWAEEEGTMTSLEGRVLRRRKAVDPPAGVRSELWVWSELARRLGAPGTWSTDPAEVFDELARASAGGRADYGGLSHHRLDHEDALYWPCPAVPAGQEPHRGTPRLFLDRFPTADGRARLVPVDHEGPGDDLRPETPLYLVTGRVLQHYQSGAQTRRVAELRSAVPHPFVEVHPVLAHRLGVAPGAMLRLTSARGVVTAQARVTDRVRPDTVFMPFHWSGPGSVNRVTSSVTDPVSGMPEFKVSTVAVEPVEPGTSVAGLAAATPTAQEVDR